MPEPRRMPASVDAYVASFPDAGPKGNLQFALTDPIPYDLVARIVAALVELCTPMS
ncbi:MAG: hypothetical protein NTW15_21080 [Burkholderiales bacterium]|nr:hypothetical protein [Burkholderiales bacterium]